MRQWRWVQSILSFDGKWFWSVRSRDWVCSWAHMVRELMWCIVLARHDAKRNPQKS